MRFGQRFLNIINKKDTDQKSIYGILSNHPIATVSQTAQETYNFHHAGSTIAEIAHKRGISAATVASHLVSSMKLGYPVKLIEFGVTEEMRDDILKNYRTLCPEGKF